MIHPGKGIAPYYEREAVENLRRIVRRTFVTAPEVVSAARGVLVTLGEVLHTCSIHSKEGEPCWEIDNGDRSHMHAIQPKFRSRTMCGIEWSARLSASSFELKERIDCEECQKALTQAALDVLVNEVTR